MDRKRIEKIINDLDNISQKNYNDDFTLAIYIYVRYLLDALISSNSNKYLNIYIFIYIITLFNNCLENLKHFIFLLFAQDILN